MTPEAKELLLWLKRIYCLGRAQGNFKDVRWVKRAVEDAGPLSHLRKLVRAAEGNWTSDQPGDPEALALGIPFVRFVYTDQCVNCRMRRKAHTEVWGGALECPGGQKASYFSYTEVDVCKHCKRPFWYHVEGRCVFAPTTFKAMDATERSIFLVQATREEIQYALQ